MRAGKVMAAANRALRQVYDPQRRVSVREVWTGVPPERRALLQLAKEFERRAKVAWAARAVSHSARYRSGAWTQAAALAREAAAGLA